MKPCRGSTFQKGDALHLIACSKACRTLVTNHLACRTLSAFHFALVRPVFLLQHVFNRYSLGTCHECIVERSPRQRDVLYPVHKNLNHSK